MIAPATGEQSDYGTEKRGWHLGDDLLGLRLTFDGQRRVGVDFRLVARAIQQKCEPFGCDYVISGAVLTGSAQTR